MPPLSPLSGVPPSGSIAAGFGPSTSSGTDSVSNAKGCRHPRVPPIGRRLKKKCQAAPRLCTAWQEHQIFERIKLKSSLRASFILDLDLDESRMNKSAGFTLSASAIFTIMSKEGFAFPASIPPIVPVPQAQRTESLTCDMPAFSR